MVRHRNVRVSQNIVVEPWTGAFSRMTSLSSWHTRPGRNSNNVWNPLPRARKSFPIPQPSVGKCNAAIFLSSSLARGRRPSCQPDAVALLGH